MIEPYQAIGLVPTMWGIRRREDIRRNLEHLDRLVTASTWLGGLDLPVRLVAIPEGALQGFDDLCGHPHKSSYAETCVMPRDAPDPGGSGGRARNIGIISAGRWPIPRPCGALVDEAGLPQATAPAPRPTHERGSEPDRRSCLNPAARVRRAHPPSVPEVLEPLGVASLGLATTDADQVETLRAGLEGANDRRSHA